MPSNVLAQTRKTTNAVCGTLFCFTLGLALGTSAIFGQTIKFAVRTVDHLSHPHPHPECASFRTDQNSSLTEKHALDIISTLVSHNADAATCPLFFNRYSRPLIQWTPWQPAETLTKWSRNFTCQHAEFCDNMYPLDETSYVAQVIYRHQNPRDCSSARYLVITKEWDYGAGSTIHIKAYGLLAAIISGRVLVEDPDIKWPKTNPQTCESQDWSCYFARLTKCSLPEGWKSSAKPFTNITYQEDQFVTHISSNNYAGRMLDNARDARNEPGTTNFFMFKPTHLARPWHAFQDKPRTWWLTQATAYAVRPNERTLRAACFLSDCMFGAGQQPPRPFAAMFIRRGDKWTEAQLYNASVYFDLLSNFAPKLNSSIRNVFVGTDDPNMLSQVLQEYSHEWDLSFIGYPRQPKGNSQGMERKRYNSASIELQMLITLAENYISSTADVLIGTLSSNQCRLMDELRKLQGKGRMPYLSPEHITSCLTCR